MRKSQSTIKPTIRLLWGHVWKYPKHSIGLITLLPITILVHQFLPPLIVADILSRLSSGNFEQGNLWGSFGISLLIFAALRMTSATIAWRIIIVLIWRLQANVTRDVARRVFNHLMNQGANFHANRFGGSLVSQASKLTSAFTTLIETTVYQSAILVLFFIFTTIILLPKVPLFVLALLIFSAVYMTVATFVTRRVREVNTQEAAAVSKQTGLLADSLTNVMAVKSFAASPYERGRFNRATEKTRQKTLEAMRISQSRELYFSTATSSITVLSLIISTASVVLFNADIATVFLIAEYTGIITAKLWEFSTSTLRNYNRAFADASDMVEILAIEPEVKDPANPEKSRITNGAISFNNVHFAHSDANERLFADLHITIRPGEKIGLVGHSGSGKTTFTKLLLRFVDINDGEILIDNQNIANITQDDLRRNIAYVPQEPLLFHRTIRENIAYGKSGASKAEIEKAAQKAHAAEFIENLPEQYNTLVGERGVKLSGGQRQRIAIARAILKDAPILVLDEATSALDSESERLIQQALWELMQGRTAIVIAHRLSTIQKMDRILVMENGKIIEQGTHQKLLAKNGVYAQLWKHQSGGFIEE